MNLVEKADQYHQDGFNCAQSVCAAFAESAGIDRATALKLSAGFGGGMGRMGHTCGAVTGAFMALGAKYGFTEASPEAKASMYARIQEFAETFLTRRSSLLCRDLLGYDLSIPEQLEQVKEQNLFATLCADIIRDAGEILEEMMAR